MSGSYYDTLGVPRDADAEQIKKAYRKLAMESHPDRNNGSAEAEERFKQISEAYEVLKDPQRRAAYDRFGEAGVKGRGGAGGPFQGGFDLHDAIEIFMRDFGGAGFGDLFGTGRRRGGARKVPGENVRVRLAVTLADVSRGAKKRLRLAILEPCEECRGSGSADPGGAVACTTCGGSGEERIVQHSVFGQMVSVIPCRSCGGEGRSIKNPCSSCHGEGRIRKEQEIEVEVPPGVTSENFITIRGRGNTGPRGGPRGDILVLLEVEEDERFVRDGDHLVTEVVVSFAQAALGVEVDVPTIEGTRKLDLPAGVQSGQTVRIRGEGVPELHSNTRGDLLVRVRVWTPTKLSREQKDLIERLRGMEDAPPERVEEAPEGLRGLWSKVKEAFTG